MMKTAQSPHIPAEGTRPGLSDIGWLAAFSVRGIIELVRARWAFARLSARDIVARNSFSRTNACQGSSRLTPAHSARIAYVLPRLSDRLPWRSDCLIQALAAQNWLLSLGAASEIQIGVEHPEGGDFGAHAWLIRDGEVITGGDIDKYHLLLSESAVQTE